MCVCVCVCVYVLCVCVYIYIYKTVFNIANPEWGIIPNRKIKIFKNRMLNLSYPSQ